MLLRSRRFGGVEGRKERQQLEPRCRWEGIDNNLYRLDTSIQCTAVYYPVVARAPVLPALRSVGSEQGCNCNSIRDGTTGSDFLHHFRVHASHSYQWLNASCCRASANRFTYSPNLGAHGKLDSFFPFFAFNYRNMLIKDATRVLPYQLLHVRVIHESHSHLRIASRQLSACKSPQVHNFPPSTYPAAPFSSTAGTRVHKVNTNKVAWEKISLTLKCILSCKFRFNAIGVRVEVAM